MFFYQIHICIQSTESNRYKSGDKKTGRRGEHRAYERVFPFVLFSVNTPFIKKQTNLKLQKNH